MKKISGSLFRLFITLAFFALITPSLTVSAQDKKKTGAAGPLVYNYPPNISLSYTETTKVVQTMDINGQSMQTNVNSVVGVTLKALGLSEANAKIEVKVDTMAQNIDSPAGVTGGSIDGVKGKTFNIVVSPNGKITDNGEAVNIKYDAGNGQQADAVQIIDNFFPILPTTAMTPGYTWTSTDSINSKTPGVTTTGTVTSESLFDGFEIYRGLNCAKITSKLSGTRIMKTQSQGMDIKISGPYTGTTTVYFAPAEGYFMKQEVTSRMNGLIEITTPDAMSFPIVMDITLNKELK